MDRTLLDNQLRWVILLLAAAVILPTVCLLWFMNQTVKNERMAIKQRFINFYDNEIDKVTDKYNEQWNKWTENAYHIVKSTIDQKRYNCDLFGTYLDFKVDTDGKYSVDGTSLFEGVLVYDADGNIEYPSVSDYSDLEFDLPDRFTDAWSAEYTTKEFNRAIELYNDLEKNASNDYVRRAAIMGRVRCLRKQGELYDAWSACSHIYKDVCDGKENFGLYEPVKKTQAASIPIIMDFYILRAELFKEMLDKQDPALQEYKIDYYHYNGEINGLYNLAIDSYSPVSRSLSAETRIHLLHKFLELAKDSTFSKQLENYPAEAYAQREQHKERLSKNISIARHRLISEEIALHYAESYPTIASYGEWAEKTNRNGIFYHQYNGKYYVSILSGYRPEIPFGRALFDIFKFSSFYCKTLDSDNNVIGQSGDGTGDFLFEKKLNLNCSNKSKIQIFCETPFDETVKRQQLIYVWTGSLMALLVLLAGGISIRAVNRQIKMNRLKNDFIATVTHELKTPLSSMRLLVDTLLEGNYRDEQTVPEYLGLIANENKRLSHLIDSFLTFSRMERNKQVFDFQSVSPKVIAEAGVEAAQAKLKHDGCDFSMEISDAAANVRADKDAMVTVLVNLLENACKYSGDDKRIRLMVDSQNGNVCFAVKDNGIGLSKRAQKRIFNRFYQVDSRLSRTTEGCGLGLSIVKFIVDAHKGTINVESQPGQGSTFTVKLPKS